jgi:hypothetical protein
MVMKIENERNNELKNVEPDPHRFCALLRGAVCKNYSPEKN